jgi:hypothetical protein
MNADPPLVIKTGKEFGSPKQVGNTTRLSPRYRALTLTLQADAMDNKMVADESFCSPEYSPSWARGRFVIGQGPLVIKTGKEFGTPKQVNIHASSWCWHPLMRICQAEDVAVMPSENFVDGYYIPYRAAPSAMSSMESRPDVGCGHLFQAPADECNENVSVESLDAPESC